ncbi:solute carrier family 46 member 3-like isoform X2 [Homarus americanus]|uniref:solute carrier family 46 member 3-like isoform X2 n=1 Tax=Homarus americanus TaxID=6706 RepID=UPI001C47F388|nr:solute carrier family 46 member 3-like isoform X2 [Homarus americanus]
MGQHTFEVQDTSMANTSPLLGDNDAQSKETMGARQQEEGRVPPQVDPPYHYTSPFNPVTRMIKQAAKNVTLEPMLFLKMLAEGNYGVVADTLEIDRVCRVNLNFTEEECAHMDSGNYTHVQVAVQRFQNTFNYNQSLMDSLIPLAVVLFMGSLSDHHGRKPPMLAVLAGFVAVSCGYLLVSLKPTWPVQVLYGATLAIDITGSWVVFNMAVYSYVADITTPENRTKRLGVLDACWYLGGPIGRLIGGWLFRAAGYPVVFLLSAVLWIICFMYVLLWVSESVDRTTQRSSPQEVQDARFGPLRHVVALLRTAFKSRPGRGRFHLVVLLILKLMVFLVQGHQMYLWARRVLKWGPAEFSTWTSLDSVIHQAGMVTWVWLASRLGLHDTSVAVGGLVSLGLWSAVLACIMGPGMWWLVVVASVVGMLEPCIEPALRTMLTTVVGVAEAGKVLALTGLLEAAWLSVDRTIFTFLYNTFVKSFPQINFVVQSCLCVVIILICLLLRLDMGRQPSATHTPGQPPVQATVYSVQYPESSPKQNISHSPPRDTPHAHYI